MGGLNYELDTTRWLPDLDHYFFLFSSNLLGRSRLVEGGARLGVIDDVEAADPVRCIPPVDDDEVGVVWPPANELFDENVERWGGW